MKKTEYLNEKCIQCQQKKLIIQKSSGNMPIYETMEYLTCKNCGRQQMRFKHHHQQRNQKSNTKETQKVFLSLN